MNIIGTKYYADMLDTKQRVVSIIGTKHTEYYTKTIEYYRY